MVFIPYLECEECGQCPCICKVLLHKARLAAAVVGRWANSPEMFTKELSGIFEAYFRPQVPEGAKIIERSRFDKDCLGCPCPDGLIDVGMLNQDSDISVYKCVGCGSKTYVP